MDRQTDRHSPITRFDCIKIRSCYSTRSARNYGAQLSIAERQTPSVTPCDVIKIFTGARPQWCECKSELQGLAMASVPYRPLHRLLVYLLYLTDTVTTGPLLREQPYRHHTLHEKYGWLMIQSDAWRLIRASGWILPYDDYTYVIRKVSTVCAYLSRIL